MRNVLITTDEVVFHAPTKHTLDPRMIEQSIIIAEERFIVPALGYAYYEALVTEKNKLVTAGNKAALQTEINNSLPTGSQPVTLTEGDIINALEYLTADNLTLWKQILWKLTAECVMMLATPEAFVQFGSEGAVHNTPAAGPMGAAGLHTPDLRSIRWVMDKKMQDRIDPLRQSLHNWICKQKVAPSSKYPLYTTVCDCDVDGVAYKRKSDIVMGIYDEDEPYCCP